MKLGTLVDPRFKSAIAKLQNAPLSLKTAFKLRGLVKAIEKELTTYEETRQAALNKYGKKNEDGSLLTLGENKNVQFDEGQYELFFEELRELAALEVDLPQLDAADLGNITVSADDLAMLEELIKI